MPRSALKVVDPNMLAARDERGTRPRVPMAIPDLPRDRRLSDRDREYRPLSLLESRQPRFPHTRLLVEIAPGHPVTDAGNDVVAVRSPTLRQVIGGVGSCTQPP